MKLFVLIIMLLSVVSSSNARTGEDYRSAYFLLSDNYADFSLLESNAKVNISGVMADVTITQIYTNEGDRTIEAKYLFPASTSAAVYSMKLKIGDRILYADVQEKKQARRNYEQAKSEGKTASLLEQINPNVFSMNVANILPGDKIEVEMRYSELLIPEDKIYSFIYPTAIGPKYIRPEDKDKAGHREFSSIKNTNDTKFDIQLNVKSGIPIENIECKTHKVSIEETNNNKNYDIQLDESEQFQSNRDFVLKYKLAGNKIKSGLMITKGQEENFFMMMLQAPNRVAPEEIPDREYIFVIDVSGSMRGAPMVTSKKLMVKLLTNLKETDKFNVLLFSGASELFSKESLIASDKNIEEAMEFIDTKYSLNYGGTEILPALKRSLDLSKEDDLSRSIVVITDGYISVEKEVFDLIEDNLGEANLFAFGIGSSINHHLIEGMAHIGQGEPFKVENQNMADSIANNFIKYIETPVMTDITVDFGELETYDVEPKTIPDILADRPILVYGKYKGHPSGTIEVKGKTGKEELKVRFPVSIFAIPDTSQALKYLWARKKLTKLQDYAGLNHRDLYEEEILALGLKYKLLTKYTSFIAIDDKVRESKKTKNINSNANEDERITGESLGALLSLQAGVSTGLGIRGGRTSGREVQIDGVAQTAEFTGSGGAGAYSPTMSNFATEQSAVKKGGQGARLGGIEIPKDRSGKGSSLKGRYPIASKILAEDDVDEAAVIDIKVLEKKIMTLANYRYITEPTSIKMKILINDRGVVVDDKPMDNKVYLEIVNLLKKDTHIVPAIKNNRPVAAWYTFSIELKPKSEISILNDGKEYILKNIGKGCFKHTVRSTKQDKIKFRDELSLKYKAFTLNGIDCGTGSIDIMFGIGEIYLILKHAMKQSRFGEKILVMLPVKEFNRSAKPNISINYSDSHVLMEIEILKKK